MPCPGTGVVFLAPVARAGGGRELPRAALVAASRRPRGPYYGRLMVFAMYCPSL